MTDKFAIPSDLSPRSREAAEIILAHARAKGVTQEGRSKLFYSPAEWRERGESHGNNADLIVIHDEAATLKVFRAATPELERKGFYAEEVDDWYSIVLNETLMQRTMRGE